MNPIEDINQRLTLHIHDEKSNPSKGVSACRYYLYEKFDDGIDGVVLFTDSFDELEEFLKVNYSTSYSQLYTEENPNLIEA